MNEETYHLGIKGIIRNKKGEILLLKVNTDKLSKVTGWDGQEYWDIPGGRVKRGETMEETLKKEIKEETGLEIDHYHPFGMTLSNIKIPTITGEVRLILAIYLVETEGSENITLSEEHKDYCWFKPKDAAKKLAFKYPPELTETMATL